MAIFLYIILVLLVLYIIYKGLKDPVRIYQFPFGAASVFLGFIILPLFGLIRVDYLPEWALERYILMCILCLLMCWFGDFVARNRSSTIKSSTDNNPNRWLIGATVLILVGGLAYLKNRSLFQAGFNMGTGITVAINFFVTLLRYGFIMALIHLLRRRSRYALVLALLATLFYLDRIVFLGRRQDTIEFAFVLAGSVWFVLHKALPRSVVIVGFVLFTLFFLSTGYYRSVVVSRTGEREWSKLKEIDFKETLKKTAIEGSTETIAGIYLTAACADNMAFDFGLNHWNVLIFHYIPAQIFGSDFKLSLNLPVPNLGEIAYRNYGFIKSTGSTVTGMVDCYSSFWYFGCLKFFIIAYIMQRLYRRALDGSIIAQSLYLFMMTNALHAITHSTYRFVDPWLHVLFFWIPLMFYAAKKNPKIDSISLWRTNAAVNYFPSPWPISSRSSAGS